MQYPSVHVSKMSGKLEGFLAINTNTLTNPYCMTASQSPSSRSICARCYSVSMLKTFRASCVPSFERNSEALGTHIIGTDMMAPRFDPYSAVPYVRFSGHGELINTTHLRNLYAIASASPDVTFALWTKRSMLVYMLEEEGVLPPPNLVMVYSNVVIDQVMPTPPRLFDKVFNNVEDNPEGARVNCQGKCRDCLKCYSKNGVTVIVELVK